MCFIKEHMTRLDSAAKNAWKKKSDESSPKLYSEYSRNLIFIIADRARAWGIYKKGCRCGERLRAKAGGGESLSHSRNRNRLFSVGWPMLWNRLATPQDTHDQESNAPSAPLAKCTRFGCARDWEDKQQWLDGEAPSATARLYSNGRNSYSFLVPCARRPFKIASCSSFSLLALVPFNAFF